MNLFCSAVPRCLSHAERVQSRRMELEVLIYEGRILFESAGLTAVIFLTALTWKLIRNRYNTSKQDETVPVLN
jgi:hypothetical protein